jgi:prepilin-type processing-associated H-X9-DG protein
LYVGDSNNFYPAWWNNLGTNAVPWANALNAYYKLRWQNKKYHCPDYKGEIVAADGVRSYSHAQFNLWGSYAYNKGGTRLFQVFEPTSPLAYLGLSGNGGFVGELFGESEKPYAVPESRIRIPSEMFAISDSRVGPWGLIPSADYGINWMDIGIRKTEVALLRHGKGSNFLYCDGHIDLLKRADFIDPRKTGRSYNSDHEFHQETWGWISLPQP